MQRLNHGKRSAEARAVAAENAAQQLQQELAALKMLTASMLAQPQGGQGGAGPLTELEGTESAKPGSTMQASNSVVDTLTQQKGSCVRVIQQNVLLLLFLLLVLLLLGMQLDCSHVCSAAA